MVLMKKCVLSLNKKTTTLDVLLSNCPQVLTIFKDYPLNISLAIFWYMITRLWNLVQLSIYSTRALFHKYCVTMGYI